MSKRAELIKMEPPELPAPPVELPADEVKHAKHHDVWDESSNIPKPVFPKIDLRKAVELVYRRVCKVPAQDICNVNLYITPGTHSKLYLIERMRSGVTTQQHLMRVCLPVDPGHRTLSEVTALNHVRKRTNNVLPITVPKVIDYENTVTDENELGFEWVLMSYVPGEPAIRHWRKMTMEQKVSFVEQIAEFQSRYISDRFEGIGSLVPSMPTNDNPDPNPVAGHLVHPFFFSGSALDHDVNRGPFKSSHDFVMALLDLAGKMNYPLEDTEDGEEIKKMLTPIQLIAREKRYKIASSLDSILSRIFPDAMLEDPESTILSHNNMTLSNIRVDPDDSYKITGIVGWSLASTSPPWKTSNVPLFLTYIKAPREKRPEEHRYHDAQWMGEEDLLPLSPNGKEQQYWRDMMEYEVTQLLRVYCAKMKSLGKWNCNTERHKPKKDVWAAVEACFMNPPGEDLVQGLERVEKWVEDITAWIVAHDNDILMPTLEKQLNWAKPEDEEEDDDEQTMVEDSEEISVQGEPEDKDFPGEYSPVSETPSAWGETPLQDREYEAVFYS
ncbi:hypothetical protein B0T16DRAFT_415282 [Cercophora newfieldiana]|uniref:Aminoglycoside phosphotransferase domain-containing protein n=1 Tax=Cercophora newfieldiana TaxID=92897 RepID=A0AA39XZD4_9PEZI|nr:hypothetical protein B0T16DRAFT_415282 [Cercophora newfieldiana]